ncbi:MAG TPA: recombination regulator RecX [Bacillales bacterium]|nr:recombination regulator RecX [Bacillales bacterium]
MAVITRISAQKKHKDRYNIYIDRGSGEEFGFGVSEDVLITFALAKGKEIDEVEWREILFEDEVKKAFNMAVNFLSYRMRSVNEIQEYLKKKEFADEVSAQVVERLKRLRYIDDEEFAKMFVESRKRSSSKGPVAIKQELKKKGVPEQETAEALDRFTEEEQIAAAVRSAEKLAKRHRKKSNADMKRSIMQTLVGKGFSRDVIEAALNQAELEKGEDEEWAALEAEAEKADRRFGKYEKWEYKQRMKQHLYRKGYPMPLIERYLSNNESE